MLDIKEEHQFSQLRKLAQELHIPVFEAFLELEVRDKDGLVIYRHRQRSHSWCRNAYNIMFSQLAGKDADDVAFGAGLLSAKGTNAVVYEGPYPFGQRTTETSDGTASGYRAPAGINTFGIQVGSGINAESFEDYVLQTLIVEGTGFGQLSYIESEAHSITYNAGTKVLKNELIRYINNNSGASIDVNEVGLVGYLRVDNDSWNIMVSRDALGVTVTVPDTGQLKVTYAISLTYPA